MTDLILSKRLVSALELTPKQAEQAAAFLAMRERNPRTRDNLPVGVRWRGVSSDALAAWGAGTGPRPAVPGHPCSPAGMSWLGEECGRKEPHDESDLLACTITYLSAPDWMQDRMLPVLTEFQDWVWYGLNRHSVRVVGRGTRAS